MEASLQEKYENLKANLRQLGSVAVAFSSGVDSTFLLKVASDVLGDNVLAVTTVSYAIPMREQDEAKMFCKKNNIKHIICPVDLLQKDIFVENPKDRCYHCKKVIFGEIKKAAAQYHIENIVEGSNIDDDGDYRPGMKAIKELKVLSPLHDAGLTKAEIRILSKELGLATWDKPSYACLASRFVYGEPITPEKLNMVEKAEDYLLQKGFSQFRVRIHGMMARIELLPQDFAKLLEDSLRNDLVTTFKEYGFTYVSLDLGGYKTGSMNVGIDIG